MFNPEMNSAASQTAREVQSFARGRSGRLVAVSVRIPAVYLPEDFRHALATDLAALGMTGVTVRVTQGGGRVGVAAVEFER